MAKMSEMKEDSLILMQNRPTLELIKINVSHKLPITPISKTYSGPIRPGEMTMDTIHLLQHSAQLHYHPHLDILLSKVWI
jgi:hypothetical protein